MPRPTHINNLLGTIYWCNKYCQTAKTKPTAGVVAQYLHYMQLVAPLVGNNGISYRWLTIAANNYATILRAYYNPNLSGGNTIPPGRGW